MTKTSKPDGAGRSRRLSKIPRHIGPSWSLTETERTRFDLRFGVSEKIKKAIPHIHEEDHTLLFNSLAAALCFHEFSDLVDRLVYGVADEVDIEDIADDLRHVRVGFELALQALDAQMKDRGHSLDWRTKGGFARWKNDPRSRAMTEIREAWEKAGRPGAAFARQIHTRYADVITSERSIESAISRWRREKSSS